MRAPTTMTCIYRLLHTEGLGHAARYPLLTRLYAVAIALPVSNPVKLTTQSKYAVHKHKWTQSVLIIITCMDHQSILKVFEMAGSSAEDWLSMKRRSLILSAPRKGRFFLREYFLGSLQSMIERIPDNVVHFGQLTTNNEWHIVLKTEEANNKLLSAGQLLVKGVVVFWVWLADNDQFRVRMTWAPPYLPNEVITDNMARSGKVVSITHELSVTNGFEGVRTGVRTVIMSGKERGYPSCYNYCE